MQFLLSSRGITDLVWLGFLLFILIYFWRKRQEAKQSLNWLKTTGQIISCEFTRDKHRIWPKIEYAYQVNEQEYIAEHLFPDTFHNNPESKYARKIAYKAAMAWKNHEEITVYYDPFYPQRAALDVKIPLKLNVVIVLVSLLIMIHLTTIFYALIGNYIA